VDAGIHEPAPDGATPAQQLEAIRARILRLMEDSQRCRKQLFAELVKHGIRILNYADLSAVQKEYAERYFTQTIYPVLTPLAVDPARPFPHISNLSLNLSVLIRDSRGDDHFARLKVPDTLPQLLALQKTRKPNGRPLCFVWLEQVVQANLHHLFPGMEVVESHPFHITRDADSAIQELEAGDLLDMVEEGVRKRRFGAVVRLKVNGEMPDHLLDILRQNLEIEDADIYRVEGPLALVNLRTLLSLEVPALKDPPFVPAVLKHGGEEEDIFSLIRKGDILLHHPFDSFEPVVDFLRTAARDPDVLAIKMTMYRVGKNAPVVEALLEAMENRKQVAALVELKARFDEESNIEWARALEREGVHVVYGLVGLKTHSKIALVVRREGDIIRRYVHLSTGNYNAVTAHLYTDLGLFTCDPDLGADASDLFNYLTGYSAKSDYRKLLVAPINLRQRMESLIEREIANAKAGKPARVIFKFNALADPPIIRLLYRASQAGVQVDLIIRGICCLRPGIKGFSDNIRVRSVVGRYLEHTRIFYFLNGGEEEIYLASADMMPRNINRRVETMFPIEKPSLVRQLKEKVLAAYWSDNVKARIMRSDGKYERVVREKSAKPINAQVALMERKRAKGS
jgi:polyphosphate kinase